LIKIDGVACFTKLERDEYISFGVGVGEDEEEKEAGEAERKRTLSLIYFI